MIEAETDSGLDLPEVGGRSEAVHFEVLRKVKQLRAGGDELVVQFAAEFDAVQVHTGRDEGDKAESGSGLDGAVEQQVDVVAHHESEFWEGVQRELQKGKIES